MRNLYLSLTWTFALYEITYFNSTTVLKNFCLTSVNFGQNGLNIVLTIHTLQFLYQKSIIFKLTLYCNNDII